MEYETKNIMILFKDIISEIKYNNLFTTIVIDVLSRKQISDLETKKINASNVEYEMELNWRKINEKCSR